VPSFDVASNVQAIAAVNQMQQSATTQGDLLDELSSGLRITDPASGPAAYSIGQELNLASEADSAVIENVNEAVSVLQIASGGIQQISGLLSALQQLAVSSSDAGTMTSTTYQNNNTTYQADLASINQVATSTEFNQQPLLDGSYTNEAIQFGPYAQQTVVMSIPSVTTTALGIAGTAVDSSTSAAAALSAVLGAIGSVSTLGSSVGATLQELLGLLQNLAVSSQNTAAAHSSDVDANMADALTQYAVNQILFRSGAAMASSAELNPREVLAFLTYGHTDQLASGTSDGDVGTSTTSSDPKSSADATSAGDSTSLRGSTSETSTGIRGASEAGSSTGVAGDDVGRTSSISASEVA
jgi:flagellin